MSRDDGRWGPCYERTQTPMTPETAMDREDPEETETESDGNHLAGIEDGAGCTEIWERLSRRRRTGEEAGSAESDDD